MTVIPVVGWEVGSVVMHGITSPSSMRFQIFSGSLKKVKTVHGCPPRHHYAIGSSVPGLQLTRHLTEGAHSAECEANAVIADTSRDVVALPHASAHGQ